MAFWWLRPSSRLGVLPVQDDASAIKETIESEESVWTSVFGGGQMLDPVKIPPPHFIPVEKAERHSGAGSCFTFMNKSWRNSIIPIQ